MELQDLLNYVRKSNRKKVFVGFFIAALGIFMLILGLVSDEAWGDKADVGIIFGYAFALFFIVVGGFMIILSVKGNTRIKNGLHPLQVALNNPTEISVVWVYEHIVKSLAVSNHSIHLYFSNGKFEGIMPGKKHVQPLLKFLMQQYPNTRFGFSEDLKKQFNSQKKKLKKKEIDRITF